MRCTLTESLPTIQVTWQQEVNKNFVNLAAYDKKQIPNINDQYKGRVNLTILELNDTAINFWNVSTQENGCYRCIFNNFPPGSTSKKTCLSVYGESFHIKIARAGHFFKYAPLITKQYNTHHYLTPVPGAQDLPKFGLLRKGVTRALQHFLILGFIQQYNYLLSIIGTTA